MLLSMCGKYVICVCNKCYYIVSNIFSENKVVYYDLFCVNIFGLIFEKIYLFSVD